MNFYSPVHPHQGYYTPNKDKDIIAGHFELKFVPKLRQFAEDASLNLIENYDNYEFGKVNAMQSSSR